MLLSVCTGVIRTMRRIYAVCKMRAVTGMLIVVVLCRWCDVYKEAVFLAVYVML